MALVRTRRVIDSAGADAVIAAAEKAAAASGARVYLCVVDPSGEVVAVRRTNDAQVASARVAVDKARTAAIFVRPSREMEEQVTNGRLGALALHGAACLTGGIPLWNTGEKFVAIAGGQCSGTCPVYELYVFDDGRVIFSGKKNTRQVGTARKQVGAEAYAELLTAVIRSQVLEKDLKRGTCLKGRPILTVMRSQPDGQSMVMSTLLPCLSSGRRWTSCSRWRR